MLNKGTSGFMFNTLLIPKQDELMVYIVWERLSNKREGTWRGLNILFKVQGVHWRKAKTVAKGQEPIPYDTLSVSAGLFLIFTFVKLNGPNKPLNLNLNIWIYIVKQLTDMFLSSIVTC